MKYLPMNNEIFDEIGARRMKYSMKYLPMSNEIFNEICAMENEVFNEIPTNEQ